MMDKLWGILPEKFKTWCRESATIAWARFCMLAGFLLEVVAQSADILAAVLPAVTPFVPPKWLGLVTLALSLGTEIARRRTLKVSL
jgi:hypothetical protein